MATIGFVIHTDAGSRISQPSSEAVLMGQSPDLPPRPLPHFLPEHQKTREGLHHSGALPWISGWLVPGNWGRVEWRNPGKPKPMQASKMRQMAANGVSPGTKLNQRAP